MSTYNTYFDWDNLDPDNLDPKSLPFIPQISDEQVRVYHDAALSLIASIRKTVDPSGVSEATGLISFYIMDQAVAKAEAMYNSAADNLTRFIAADYLNYVYETAKAAYADKHPLVNALGSAKDAVLNAGARAIDTSLLIMLGVGFLIWKALDSGSVKVGL